MRSVANDIFKDILGIQETIEPLRYEDREKDTNDPRPEEVVSQELLQSGAKSLYRGVAGPNYGAT
jgi:hypothetical protein